MLLVAALALQSSVPAEWLVRPGVSLGMTKIGEPQATLLSRLGKPAGGDAAMGHFWTTWLGKGGGRLDVYTTRKPGKDDPITVDIVRATSSRFRTLSGLGTGSSVKAFRAKFPAAKSMGGYRSAAGFVQIWGDDAHGIAWEFGPSDRVSAVIVHHPKLSFEKGQYISMASYLATPLPPAK